MKIAIVNKSDSTGGAAVVSFRLMEALREAGVDARMFVAEKRSASEAVELAASNLQLKQAFLSERLKIFVANGFDRETLFKIDTASNGVRIDRIPFIREADVICLNWVNQGLLSLKDISLLRNLGKPIVWTMHDMWNFTGICHHSGVCTRYTGCCGDCPLLKKHARRKDLSYKTLMRKQRLYAGGGITFIAVSNWLADLARRSTLLADAPLKVIPNGFPLSDNYKPETKPENEIRIVFGAARLDDPIKGLPVLLEATHILREKYPEEAAKMRLVTFGGLKNPDALDKTALNHEHLGMVSGLDNLRKIYEQAHIVVSTSSYETLPGTLVEGQAYGCIPVCFDSGGQSDIIDHLSTGYLARRSGDLHNDAAAIAEGIIWATRTDPEIRPRMRKSVIKKFHYKSVAERYILLFKELIGKA